MINKQNLWFITLFSLILVLGIYYVTLADESLQIDKIINNSEPVINIEESDALTALRVAEEEQTIKEIENYENILLDSSATLQEKNDAYENLKALNNNKSKIEELETLIKEKFSLEAFIKLSGDQINITIDGNDHNSNIANEIIRTIQTEFDTQMYITVKFQG